MNERSPRLDYLDSVVEAAFQRRKDDIPTTLELIASEPGKLEQTRFSSLARAYEAIGGYLYAIGYPFGEIKEAFRNAAHSWRKVFELRGTEAPFPAYVLKYDPSKPPGPEGVVELRSLHEEGAKDFSVTNSRAGYIATCEALIAGEEDIAHEISALIWDPPNARYIAPRSFCTPNDRSIRVSCGSECVIARSVLIVVSPQEPECRFWAEVASRVEPQFCTANVRRSAFVGACRRSLAPPGDRRQAESKAEPAFVGEVREGLETKAYPQETRMDRMISASPMGSENSFTARGSRWMRN